MDNIHIDMKISPKSLLEAIIDRYKNAAECFATVQGDKQKNLCRVRQGSISDEIEELVADFLFVNSGAEEVEGVYGKVDMPLTIRCQNGRDITIYPDIVISKKINDSLFRILYMADVKADSGWIRTKLSELAKMHKNHLSFLLQNDVEHTKEHISYELSDGCPYDFIFVTSANGSKKFMDSVKELNNNNEDIKTFILSSGNHPNSKKMDGIVIEDEAIKELIARISNRLPVAGKSDF